MCVGGLDKAAVVFDVAGPGRDLNRDLVQDSQPRERIEIRLLQTRDVQSRAIEGDFAFVVGQQVRQVAHGSISPIE